MSGPSRSAITTIALMLSVVPMTSQAIEGSADWCEQQWRKESARVAQESPADREALLRRWKTYGPRCAGTTVYEARLAIAHVLAGQHDEALAVLKPLAGTAHRDLVDFAALQVDYAQVFTPGRTTVDAARALAAKFRAFVASYPEFPEGHLVLGSLQTLLNEHGEAIASLERGLRSDMDVSGAYRNLTISYVAVGRYADGRRAAERAYQMNQRYSNDQWFVFALAKADGALGNFKAAEAELQAIAAKGDVVLRDPEFKEAVDFVRAHLAEARSRGAPIK